MSAAGSRRRAARSSNAPAVDPALGDLIAGAPIVARRVTSADGTSLAVYRCGRGPRVWVVPPGLGTPLVAWREVIRRFAGALTLVTWDQRGTYASAVPDDLERLRVEDHADDLEAIVAAEGLDRFILGGWSLAVQISLEYLHRHPDRVEALVLVNGAYEHVLDNALDRRLAPALKAALRLLARLGPRLGPVLAKSMALGPHVLPRLGLLAPDAPLFADVLRAFSRLDWGTYFRLMLAVNAHSAAAYLGDVRVPTLVTAGDADRMTPLALAEAMHRRIPASELVVFPGGTHYTPTEQPERLNAVLARFFDRLGGDG